jgi:hypothetical protein
MQKRSGGGWLGRRGEERRGEVNLLQACEAVVVVLGCWGGVEELRS